MLIFYQATGRESQALAALNRALDIYKKSNNARSIDFVNKRIDKLQANQQDTRSDTVPGTE